MGSDHHVIKMTFQTRVQPTPSLTPQFLFCEAPWADINRELKGLEIEVVDIISYLELDTTVGHLTSKVSLAIH